MKKVFPIIFMLIILSSSVISSNQPAPPPQYQAIEGKITQFTKSAHDAWDSEQRLKQRGFFKKIFFGADWGEARSLQNITRRNIEALNEIKLMLESCETCSPEQTALIGKTIAEMKKEQERLQTYAIIQSKLRGLFGWFKK